VILIDTSVLIDFLKEIKNPATDKFNEILELNIPFGITSHIYQELLQGTSTQKDFNSLKKYLDTFTFFLPLDSRESYYEAAKIFFQCRKKGITVRSSIDCLIVQIAIEHGLKLLHNDRDFENIKTVITKLEFY
jgi:predicted nucleic acid-binding protein